MAPFGGALLILGAPFDIGGCSLLSFGLGSRSRAALLASILNVHLLSEVGAPESGMFAPFFIAPKYFIYTAFAAAGLGAETSVWTPRIAVVFAACIALYPIVSMLAS